MCRRLSSNNKIDNWRGDNKQSKTHKKCEVGVPALAVTVIINSIKINYFYFCVSCVFITNTHFLRTRTTYSLLSMQCPQDILPHFVKPAKIWMNFIFAYNVCALEYICALTFGCNFLDAAVFSSLEWHVGRKNAFLAKIGLLRAIKMNNECIFLLYFSFIVMQLSNYLYNVHEWDESKTKMV